MLLFLTEEVRLAVRVMAADHWEWGTQEKVGNSQFGAVKCNFEEKPGWVARQY